MKHLLLAALDVHVTLLLPAVGPDLTIRCHQQNIGYVL